MKHPYRALAALMAGGLLSAAAGGCKREEPKPTSAPAATADSATAMPTTTA